MFSKFYHNNHSEQKKELQIIHILANLNLSFMRVFIITLFIQGETEAVSFFPM
jgi:hypothetical protein